MTEKRISMETVLARNDEIVSGVMDGEIMMMSIENGKYYNLNPTGSKIWELLEQPKNISHICNQLVEEFDINNQDCKQEVIKFIEKLMDRNILKIN